MEIEIKIISEEKIKPLKYRNFKPYKLCMLDQLAPSFHVPIALFYSSPDNHQNPKSSINNSANIQTLKLSLSKTLEIFYHFAGTFSGDGALVEMGSTAGVLFKEARVVGMDLATVLQKRDAGLVGRLLPLDPYAGGELPVTAVQVNAFRCGGLAIAICVSHKIADGATLSAFLSAWAESSRLDGGDGGETVALDTAAVLFPPIPGFRMETRAGMIRPPGEVVARRFVFDAASLARLRSEASSGSIVPTRVEAVTALISRAAARTKTTCGSTPATEIILHAVNLRPRTSPPLPEKTVGNIWTTVVATVRAALDSSDRLSDAVMEMRREMKNLDAERLKGKEGFGLICKRLRASGELAKREGHVSSLKFTSWIGYPIYEVDFGFGRPEWVGGTAIPIDGAVALMRDKGGDGVEALVNLELRHMASFEADQTLLTFASVLNFSFFQ